MGRSLNLAVAGCRHLPSGWTTGGAEPEEVGKCGLVVLVGYLDALADGEVMSDAAARCVAELFWRDDDSATGAFVAVGAVVGTAASLLERLFDGVDRTPLVERVRAATWGYLCERPSPGSVAGWEWLVLA